MHPTVAIVVGVHHDNVLAFVDECRYPQSASDRAQAAAALRQDDANNMESVVQELEEEQEDWDEEILNTIKEQED